MNNFETRICKYNRLLLLACGLWPDQNLKLIKLLVTVYYSIMIAHITIRLVMLLIAKGTAIVVIKVMASTFFDSLFVIAYFCCRNNPNTIKSFLQVAKSIYNELLDGHEIAIMNRYIVIAERYTICISVITIVSSFVVACATIFIQFRNVALFESAYQSHGPIGMMHGFEMGSWSNRYFYVALMLVSLTTFIGPVVSVNVALMALYSFQYVCGMFKVASHRIECALRIDVLRNIDVENNNSMYRQLVQAVDMQRKATELVENIIAQFNISFSIMIVVVVILSSCNLYLMSKALKNDQNFIEVLTFFSHFLSTLISVFMATKISQDVLDHNNNVYITVYNSHWYFAPIRMQKMVLFLLYKSKRSINLTIGRLYTPSLEGFTTVAKASVSYFTVLYSLG